VILDLRDQQPDPPPLVRGKRKHKLVVEVGRGIGPETQSGLKIGSGQPIPPEWACGIS
jgi:hypothetical protein